MNHATLDLRLLVSLGLTEASAGIVMEELESLRRQLHQSDLNFNALEAQNTRLREALDRLASSEAFDMPRTVRLPSDEELIRRIEFARESLKPSAPGTSDSQR